MRVLIIGYGDVAQRWAKAFARHAALSSSRHRHSWCALVRRPEAAAAVRQAGGVPIYGDLEDFRKLRRIAGVADTVYYLAPPPNTGVDDPRLRRALAALRSVKRFVYVSTTGVYGDCGGDWVSEARPVNAQSPRAKRRVAAERLVLAWQRRQRLRASRLRVPGIYANDRLPVERIRAGTAALRDTEDGYSNHIHAEDLARIVWLAGFRAAPARAYNTIDAAQLKMGQWFDLVADHFALPRPPRASAAEIQARVTPELWSFMRESRRLSNARMLHELRVRLRYPTPDAALRERKAIAP
jgi:nucleoside-diphosphate-sugar epimerase